MRRLGTHLALISLIGGIGSASPAGAQELADERARVLATAEGALEAISAENMIAFTDFMVDETIMFRVADRDGRVQYSARTRAESRSNSPSADIEERGFDPEVRISGPLAMVWLPYDLYLDGEWSHCGVDAFTLLRIDGDWRIASLAWTIEQPPACKGHPDGPPGVDNRQRQEADSLSVLRVSGNVKNPLSLTLADIAALPHQEVVAEVHGRSVKYRGVALGAVLQRAGVPEGREIVRTVVVARATDAYEAVFSLAELTPDFVDRIALVADARDGEPLPAGEGPVRLVVPGEKEGARWVRQLIELEVRRVR